VDLNEWARLLNTQAGFVPGARYGIVIDILQRIKRSKTYWRSAVVRVYASSTCRGSQRLVMARISTSVHIWSGRGKTHAGFLSSMLNNEFPTEDSSFDVVVAMMVMEHVFDPPFLSGSKPNTSAIRCIFPECSIINGYKPSHYPAGGKSSNYFPKTVVSGSCLGWRASALFCAAPFEETARVVRFQGPGDPGCG